MATSYNCLPSKDKRNTYDDTPSDGQYNNTNLNRNQQFIETLKIKRAPTDIRISQNYDFEFENSSRAEKNSNSMKKSSKKLPSNLLNMSRDKIDDDFKEAKNTNSSTLSLHITAYENSIEDKNYLDGSEKEAAQKRGETLGLVKKWRTSNHFVNGPSLIIQNPFEFPRQEEDQASPPELMQFTASQRLLNPNQMDADNQIIQPLMQQNQHSQQGNSSHANMVDPSSVSSTMFGKTMYGLRKLVNKPRVDDWSPMAKFFHADEALNRIARELDSFDGRRDPDRCNVLVTKLRQAQDRVLLIISEMLVSIYPLESERANRDFRAKFPDEVIHENLAGQLWFGAECLAAGSNIVGREAESERLRPLARALTKHLDSMREMLKDQALKDPSQYPDKLKDSLLYFDHLFANFEFDYVSVMVEVKSVKEYDSQQDIAVLFSEATIKAQKMGYITQEQIEYADPVMMIGLPRLAVLWALLYYPDSIKLDSSPDEMSVLFRHFQNSLIQCRSVLKVMKSFAIKELEKRLLSGNGCGDTSIEGVEKTVMDLSGNHTDQEPALNDSGNISDETSEKPAENQDDSGSLNDECQMEVILKGCSESKVVNVRIEDLIQFLFKRISAVSDQLQTNFSQEFRKIMKAVMRPVSDMRAYEFPGQVSHTEAVEEETGVEVQESMPLRATIGVRWVPDNDCLQCTSCGNAFTVFRRRHHCRNCGRLFCNRCSSNEMPIPELGYDSNVRVCNLCYLYKVNPFTPPIPNSEISTSASSDVD